MVLSFQQFRQSKTIPGTLLSGCWIAGSSLGLWAAYCQGEVFLSLFRMLSGVQPTAVGIGVAAVFPLFISAFAVAYCSPKICYACCLLRGISQGFLMGAFIRVYGSAAPMMAMLQLFSGFCVNPVMLIYWLRRLELGMQTFWEDTAGCACLCLMIGLVDLLAIAPFLADVINL